MPDAILAPKSLTLNEGSSPGNARDNHIRLYPSSDGFLYGIDDSGVITAYNGINLQNEQDTAVNGASLLFIPETFRNVSNVIYPSALPTPDQRRFGWWSPGHSTAVAMAITASGTITNTTTDTVGYYGTWQPAGTGAANKVGLSGFRARPTWNPYFYARINTNNIVGGGPSRLWLGWAATGAFPDSATLGTTRGAAFLLDTGASNVWKFATCGGTTATNTASSVTATANTVYELELWIIGANCYFSINRATPTLVTTTTPTTTAENNMAVNLINDSGSVPTLWISRLYAECN